MPMPASGAASGADCGTAIPRLPNGDETLPRPADDARQRRAARLRFNVWCTSCEQAPWHCPETTVPEWSRWLVCGKCGSRDVGFLVSGSRRDPLS
jgi:hypothetical protein